MAKTTETKEKVSKKRPPASTVEGRENQLISLAIDLVEKQLQEGSATSQVITHFLKLGSTRAAYELERLKKENMLLEARTKSIESSDRMEQLFEKALEAFGRYSGKDECDDEEYEEYDDEDY